MLDKDSSPLEVVRRGLKAGGHLRSVIIYGVPDAEAAALVAELDAAGFTHGVGSAGQGTKAVTVNFPRPR